MENPSKTSLRSTVVISLSDIIKVLDNYCHYDFLPIQLDKFVRFMLTCLGCEYQQLSTGYYKVIYHSSSLLPFNVTPQCLSRLLSSMYLTKMNYYGKSI